ncbi:MAG: pteridine reductase [Xanthomonadales bacterium]|nr:pteridine reductase [Xanthomonadales bacterium]NIN60160.1 pteridine reductase [Xanthomonadales bacterium]NIN74307.1 pteridine reductase [Xanthomonadales bacterium]NIO12816.1 pteridine reductase [Xanthomonadales bacterium]NIP12553.1 pteridine reductase [Xanthomonadales bacterium]
MSRQRVALITGAARRIGAAIASELHARGCRVVLHYRSSADAAERLAADLNRARADSAVLVQADLTRDEGPAQLAERLRELSPGLDLLVNNASRFYPTRVGEVTTEHWRDLVGSNLRGPFFLCQALLPELRQNSGAIINILDIHAERPMRGHTVYCIAKAGLAMMTRSLARELAPEVRVNGVAPGAILWPEEEPGSEMKAHILGRTALGRLGSPQDIAGAVAYLGLEAPYVTGQVLAVDGGRSLNI